MSLLDLLKDAYSKSKNFEHKNFIPYRTARQIVTVSRIDDWSKTHPLCQEHGHECSERIHLIHEIPKDNVYIFVVLVFAGLEFLIKNLLASRSRDIKLFDTKSFEHVCDSAGLSAEQKQDLVKWRSHVGVLFANDDSQDVPRDVVLPFLKRESLDRYGSYGVLYRVTITSQHLHGYDATGFIAEKRIRPMSDASQGDWRKLFREVKTLRKRSNHPNIIPLMASYTLETDESGHYVKTLHLLFPLAETDLADWMIKPQIPPNMVGLSKQDRQQYLYRSIYDLISSISYLHRDADGTVTAHHDLKPRNILLVNDKLNIADFGHTHLRPILEGSATEGVSGLGTYEYQPPEYWKDDGSRAQVKHGRAFDVWAAGCIVIELLILVVHDWQSEMVTSFRNERKANLNRDRKIPASVQDGSEHSFHNNQVVVKDWIGRLTSCGGSQRLNGVLDIVAGMLAPEPRNRPYMWEIQMDLYEILTPYDGSIPDLEPDLCVPPPFGAGEIIIYSHRKFYNEQPEIPEYTETPLHRAARKENRTRTIRLWELGWPLFLKDPNGTTPLDIMKRSDNVELRELENDVTSMLEAARTGDKEEIRQLISKGLSPMMVNADGRSAVYEAMASFQIDVVEYLLENKAEGHLNLWDKTTQELPLHAAARVGFVKALERILQYYPDINIFSHGWVTSFHRSGTALHHAAAGGHSDAVRLLLKNKAKVLPANSSILKSVGTPIHAALDHTEDPKACEIVELLLEADDGHEAMKQHGAWGYTPLMLAARYRMVKCFELLLQHGASVHTIAFGKDGHDNLLHIIAASGSHDILRRCIEDFSLKELEGGSRPIKPLEIAQEAGHKEVARLLKQYTHRARHSGGSKSGFLTSFRNGLGI